MGRHATQLEGRGRRRSSRPKAAAIALACIAASPPLIVEGASPSPVAVDLDALPPARQDLVAHGRTIACEGVWLRDVLARAGLPAGDDVRNAALTTVIVAKARDGYRVAFTLGELDAKLGNARILVATRCDGKPLDDVDGPLRLVAGDTLRAARSVRQLDRLHVAIGK